MKKVLRIVAISAGLVSFVSVLLLGWAYLEELCSLYKRIKEKFVHRAELLDKFKED